MTIRSSFRTGLRRLTTGVAATATAAGLMTAAWAVPARADEKDLAKILVGIAAVALIAKAIDDKNDRKDRDRRPVTEHRPGEPLDPGAPFVPDRSRGDHREGAARVPRDCGLEVRGEGRNRLAYAESCLVSYGFRHLPRDCAYHATIFGRTDRLYPAACLREAGFRLPRK